MQCSPRPKPTSQRTPHTDPAPRPPTPLLPTGAARPPARRATPTDPPLPAAPPLPLTRPLMSPGLQPTETPRFQQPPCHHLAAARPRLTSRDRLQQVRDTCQPLQHESVMVCGPLRPLRWTQDGTTVHSSGHHVPRPAASAPRSAPRCLAGTSHHNVVLSSRKRSAGGGFLSQLVARSDLAPAQRRFMATRRDSPRPSRQTTARRSAC